jgi:DNA polymerase-1
VTTWSDAAYLLDVSYWAHKAWHAVARDTPAGHVPDMIAPFAAMLVKLLADREPRFLIAAAEMEGPTWRHELYPAYKAGRPPHPPGFDRQVIEAIRLLELHRIPVLGAGGFEADDVIARLVRDLRAAGIAVVVITADKDLRQLVTDTEPGVVLWDGKDRWVGERTVRSEWGIGPERVGDYLALVGDSGDGIPGIKGIGAKKAPELIEGTKDLEDLLRLRMWADSAVGRALRAGEHDVRLWRRLVALREDVPVALDLEAAEVRPERYDRKGLQAFYEAAGLGRLAERMKE